MKQRTVVPAAIGLLALALIGLAAWQFWPVADLPATPPPQDDEVASPAEPVPLPHPISPEALMAREFDGREFVVGEVLAEEDDYTRYAVAYRSGSLRVTGIMNVPKATPPAQGFPLAVLNHGYIDPAVYMTGRGLRREQDYLAREGFVVIHPDYRNHAGSDKDPDAEYALRLGYTEDVVNAIYAVRAARLPYVNGEQVVMLGHSMGGGIAQSVAVVEPTLVDAIVLYAPVSGDAWENFERYTRDRPEIADEILKRYGTPETNAEFWAGASPRTHYARVVVPVMVHIGTNDESTPPVWSREIAQRLREADKTVVLHEYPGEPHEFAGAWETMMQRTVEFFRTHLR